MMRLPYEQTVDLYSAEVLEEIGEAQMRAVAEAIPGDIEMFYVAQTGGFTMVPTFVLSCNLCNGHGSLMVTYGCVGWEPAEAAHSGPCAKHESAGVLLLDRGEVYNDLKPSDYALAVGTTLGMAQRPDLMQEDVQEFLEKTMRNADLDTLTAEAYLETFGEFKPPFCDECNNDPYSARNEA